MPKSKNPVLVEVKRELMSEPSALRWLENLEEHFPETLRKFLAMETPKETLLRLARDAQERYEEMTDSLREELGIHQAMQEARRECLLVDWSKM